MFTWTLLVGLNVPENAKNPYLVEQGFPGFYLGHMS